MANYLFTSESVSEGHPDKIADQISDAILDAFLKQDPNAKVACECLITAQHLVIAGEVSSTAQVDVVSIAKDVIRKIGYTDQSIGFDYATAAYTSLLHQQSPEINFSVSDGGAGDQGMMFGYACNETPELMPLPIVIAHQLMQKQSEMRKNGNLSWLLPDAKSQVTVHYENNIPTGIESVVLSTQHRPEVDQQFIREEVIHHIIKPVLQNYFENSKPEYFINPSGSFTVGGPHGDTGLTGRKIVVDTYGGMCAHGGGAFSGKDPSKVDRSGAYAARYVAKHLVAAGLAARCTVQISYAIGKADPTSILIDFHGTGSVSEDIALTFVQTYFDLTPKGIIEKLKLKNPIYSSTAAYGHFGKENLPWEVLDENIIASLKSYQRMDQQLLKAYIHTNYTVEEPDLIINIGMISPALEMILQDNKYEEWAYLTSVNPNGQAHSESDNQAYFEKLKESINGFTYFEGEGKGVNSSWPAERSVLVLGIQRAHAEKLGKLFQQNAIVAGIKGKPAELVIIK
jgi:S-adenosylmethionine synthetase